MNATAPTFYNDSIQNRAAYSRFRNIGSPYAFLTGIGVEAILEEIYKGANVVDVARKLNVSIGVLMAWLNTGGHEQAIEDAVRFSAEGYLSEAGRLLREAVNDFQLKKAKEIANHGRFMASKLDRSKYGQDTSKIPSATGVTFVMHIGGQTAEIRAVNVDEQGVILDRPPEIRALEGQFSIVPVPPTPQGVLEPLEIGPFEEEPFVPNPDNLPEYLRE